jgi:low temperature requirement protein LtrA
MVSNAPEYNRRANGPRLRTLDTLKNERHASWLELFFDLVFVLAVAQVARILAHNTDIPGVLKYTALFVPIWWSWVIYTFYADRFESTETAYRLFTFAGMLAVAAFALTLGEAFTPGGDMPFVITCVGVRLVSIGLYVRSAYYIPLARVLSAQYIVGLGLSVLILLLSLSVPAPSRYYLWAVAMLIELFTPFLIPRMTRAIPVDRSHLPERFGLFTIIVLGEAVIATATGASSVQWNATSIAAASTGFAMAACIWWINFEFLEDDALKSRSLIPRIVYLYAHFFIVASIVAIGIGVEHAIKDTVDAHLHLPTLGLLGGGIALYLSAVTIVKFAAGVCKLLFARIVTIAFALAMIYVGQYLPPIASVAAFFAILVSGVWLEGRFGEVRPHEEESSSLEPCEHADLATFFTPRSTDGCEECVKNNYKWVHLRLCLICGHVGCCDSSIHKHATKHYHEERHPIMASLEPGENWSWCYTDERFVPIRQRIVRKSATQGNK